MESNEAGVTEIILKLWNNDDYKTSHPLNELALFDVL